MEKELAEFSERRETAIKRIMAQIKNNGNDQLGTCYIKDMLEERNKTLAICYHMDGICPICNKNNISVDLTKVINTPVCGKTCLGKLIEKTGPVSCMRRLNAIIKEKGIKYVPLVYVYK